MKKVLSVFLVVVMIVTALPLTTFNLSASAEVYGYYYYEVYNGEATVTGVSSSISGDITIPSTLGGYPVTNIGDYAFECCDDLTSVTIPDSVTSIGEGAFFGCSSLTAINVDSGNQNYSSDDGVFFNKNKTELICCPGGKSGEYVIPNSVTSIGKGAFCECRRLTSVIIPDSVLNIGDGAFLECISLTSVTMPDSVTSIGGWAFSGCSSLTSVIIPNSVTSIGSSAFYYCSRLTSVTIGDSVLNIGNSAFADCSSLTSVTIGDSVLNIGDYAFYYCESLTSITIPDSVLNIGDYAFSYCDSLTSVTIPDSVTSIGDYAFEYCRSLISVTIGDSVTSIGEWAFEYCYSLTSVTIGNSVLNIGNGAFSGCISLTAINVGSGNQSYSSEDGVLFSKNKAELICCPAGKSGEYVIPNSVTSIGDEAFEDCSNLISVTIGDSVTNIGYWAFLYCDYLTIYGYSGSVAETYAKENAIKFVSLGCSHKNTTVHPAKASTCKVQGNNKYTTCNDCGKVISGSNAKLPLAGHKYTTKTTKATLTKNGSVVKKCSVCGKVASTTTIYYPKTVSIAATTYTYNGKVITPAVTVKNSKGTALKKGTDYTVTYGAGRKNVGKYKVTVTFKGNYSGTKTFYFTINPVKTTVSKLTAGKKSIKVAISKKSTQVTGYQIQYSTSKTFKSAKTATVKSYKTTSVNLTKLSAKKTYYVRVRTYKTVGKTKYYSAWSTAKKVTTKK